MSSRFSADNHQDMYGHVLFVYDTGDERLQVLTEYFKDGLENGELCIFVTPDTSNKVIRDFLTAGLDVREAVWKSSFRIFEMADTYLPHGQFVADHMLSNVSLFLKDAKASGYTGLRTAGEMTWLYEHPEFLAASEQYERDISGMTADNLEFTGLCLYPFRPGYGAILDKALQTHPNLIYDGTEVANGLNDEEASSTQSSLDEIKKFIRVTHPRG